MAWMRSFIVGLCHLILVKSADVHYSVTEQSKSGLLVGNIPDSIDLVNLVSQASIPYMKYSFLSIDSNLRKYFSLNEKSGDLRLSSSEVLDREAVCQFDVNCNLELQIAIQSTHTQFFRKVLVSIDVIDINDHAPEFKENFTTLTISESVQIPSSFPLPSAIDKDTGINNSLQGYEIFPQDGPFELSYSKTHSNLMLRVVKELDHETRDLYSVKIVARDGGDPPREGVLNADIIVEDINDNAPKFTQDNYAKVVDETVNQGSLLLTLKAMDADSGKNGHVRYRLSPQQPAHILSMFSVDENLGELRLVGDFQYAETELYKIDVEASDMGDQPFTTKTTVSITVEDTINSRPKLLVSYLSQNNYSSISEYANLGVAVAHILVKDTDRGPNGIVQCNLTSGGYFELQSYDIKEYKVIVARQLDREAIQVHNVTIECVDAGLPSLSTIETFQVRVIDENDNAPIFPQRFYNMTIRENNEIGREILTVAALDADDRAVGNGKITYSLQDVSNGQLLINPDTGVIKAMTSFDYELKRQINFTVVADDNGIPRRSAKVPVRVTILDENDQVPYFAQSRFTIAVSEYASRGDLIGEITAFDFEQGRNGQFEITKIPGSGRGKRTFKSGVYYSGSIDNSPIDFEKLDDDKIPFEVHHNGSLFLLGELDHEIRCSYEFEVRVTDKGEPPLSDTATVVIDVADENDNTPYILHPNASEVMFVALTGVDAPRTLFSFEVLDRDSGTNSFLVYTVTARNDSGRFDVDSQGEVKRTRDFSYRDAGTYKLSVMVRDSGTPPLSDVRTFLIQISGGNGTAGRSGLMKDQYIVIALTLVCVTILLSVTIVLIIVVMRRLDKRRKHSAGLTSRPPMHIQNSRVITTFMDPMKMDNFRHDSTNREYRDDHMGSMDSHKMNDSHFGFSSSSGSINKNGVSDNGYQSSQVNNLNLPPQTSTEDDIDLEGLQLHHVLLESYQLDSHVASMVLEDGASDSSGETITSDSGRGGSDEDISNSNITSANSMDGSRSGHNGSFQSCTSTFGQSGSLKSSVKDPVRSSARKHVTFKEFGRFRNNLFAHSAAKQDNPGPNANSLNPNAGGTLAGPLQKQALNTFTGGVSPKQQQQQHNLLNEMNIPVSIDNSNLNVDSPTYTGSVGYHHSKNTMKDIPSRFNYAEEHARDSPRLMTFSSAASSQQPFQNPSHHHNTLYKGEDNIPSPMPRESPSEWRTAPGIVGRDNPNGQPQQTYMAMNAPRDLLKSQQRNSLCRSPSPQVQQNSFMLACDTPSTGRIQYKHPTQETAQEAHKVTSFTNERNRGQYCSSKDNLNLNQTNSLTSTFSQCSLSSPLESPAPRLPPRETKPFNGLVLQEHSLHGKDPSKNSVSPTNNKMVLPDHMACSYDWTNDSIATTDDLDDQRSTTTSGSYTVDNEDDYLALEFKPKDVVV